MHRASYRFMPPCGITETLSDVESVRVVHSKENLLKWIIITFIARFPHIFIYTFGGEKLVSNQYGVIIAGAAIAGIVYLFVAAYLRKRHKEQK